jgi:signal peptidase I
MIEEPDTSVDEQAGQEPGLGAGQNGQDAGRGGIRSWVRDLVVSVSVSAFIFIFLYLPVRVVGTSLLPLL